MNEATIGKSYIDGSNAEYVVMQGYLRQDENVLHLQGRGPQVNREYGISHNIGFHELDVSLTDWMNTITRNFPSMAGTDRTYFQLQMRYVPGTGNLNFQVKNYLTHNTPYGGNFFVSAIVHPDLKKFWDKVMSAIQEGPQKAQQQSPQQVVEIEN